MRAGGVKLWLGAASGDCKRTTAAAGSWAATRYSGFAVRQEHMMIAAAAITP
jgi:hypothetical protein